MNLMKILFKYGALICIVVASMLTMLILQAVELYELRNKPTVECPKSPSCYECGIARETYAKYQDSLEYGPRRHRARYEDSTRKYGAILRQN